jgi:hypothetical protein
VICGGPVHDSALAVAKPERSQMPGESGRIKAGPASLALDEFGQLVITDLFLAHFAAPASDRPKHSLPPCLTVVARRLEPAAGSYPAHKHSRDWPEFPIRARLNRLAKHPVT